MARMGLAIVFLLGIGNFALHRAVMASGHPLLARRSASGKRIGGRIAFALEFFVLVAAMLLVENGYHATAVFYAIYTLLNVLGAWLMATGRV